MVRHTDVVCLQRKIAFLVFSKLHGFELERDRKLFSVCFLSFCRFSLFCFGLWFVFRYVFFLGEQHEVQVHHATEEWSWTMWACVTFFQGIWIGDECVLVLMRNVIWDGFLLSGNDTRFPVFVMELSSLMLSWWSIGRLEWVSIVLIGH